VGMFAGLLAGTMLAACSPRDYLTHRLASDLISGSSTFRAPQRLELRTGIVSNADYLSPDYLSLQHRGWISAVNAACVPPLAKPCWDVSLTPSGVETIQSLITPGDSDKQILSIPAARREVTSITAIAKQGDIADVEFTWHWIPMNELGAALYSGENRYTSTVKFRRYDDGWRVIERSSLSGQPLDDALKSAEPAQ
jgi:hypothetical protein